MPVCRAFRVWCKRTHTSLTVSSARPTRRAQGTSGEAMIMHPIRWQAPQPLWARFGATVAAAATAADQTRPAILRFASDEFMDQLLAMLAAAPPQLGQVLARPETWRSPGGETPDLVERVALPAIAR